MYKNAVLAALLSTAAAMSALGANAQTAAEMKRNAVIAYTLVDGVGAPDPLTKEPGDVRRGQAVFQDPERGGCAGCHAVEGDADSTQIGPTLSGVGARLSKSTIRLWIINPSFFKPDSQMPAYFSLYDGDADEPSRVATRLAPQEIEDLVAYLDNLKPISAAAEASQD